MLEVKVPVVGESITEVTISNWLVKDGDVVDIDQPLCEIDSDKATFEVAAEKAGKVSIVAKAGDTVAIGAVIAKIDTSVAVPATAKKEPVAVAAKEKVQKENSPEPQAKGSKEVSYAKGIPSPAAAKLIAENDLKGGTVLGTGKEGRITKEDVLKTIAQKDKGNGSHPLKQGSFSREMRKEKMSTLRKTIAKRLVAAKNETAMPMSQ